MVDAGIIKQNYPPLVVYQKLPLLLKNRKLNLVSGSLTTGTKGRKRSKEQKSADKIWLTDKDFMHDIQFEGFIIIEAEDDSLHDRRYAKFKHKHTRDLKTRTFIIILDREQTQIKSAQLHKILMKLPDIKAAERKFNAEVIMISENKMGVHPRKKMEQFKEIIPSITGGSDLVEVKESLDFVISCFFRRT